MHRACSGFQREWTTWGVECDAKCETKAVWGLKQAGKHTNDTTVVGSAAGHSIACSGDED